jgi:hypothetical protein
MELARRGAVQQHCGGHGRKRPSQQLERRPDRSHGSRNCNERTGDGYGWRVAHTSNK